MMFNATPWMQRLLTVTPLALAFAGPACGQISALRQSDDQFIQGLREQGMSDLLERFVEAEPPDDPIAQLAVKVALQEFVAENEFNRAIEASQTGNFAEANRLFEQSRASYEQVLDAQRTLIRDHKDDERMPLWQTDFAEMLLLRYLPKYYQQVSQVYEFGLPSEEQEAAFEKAMVEALTVTVEATTRLDNLINRLAAEDQLKTKLEEMGIFYRLEDYRSINTPYWLAQAAHGVSLLPSEATYYSRGNVVRSQKLDAEAEKKRLRYLAVDALGNKLVKDERKAVRMTAKLFSGRTLAWSKDLDDIDEGVDILEDVISEASGQEQGFLATLGKAVGRWNGGELDVALEVLGGIDRQPYVEAGLEQGNTSPRLLAADLMFKILMAEANKKPPSEQPALIAKAYETAYVPLISGVLAQQFKDVLFERWTTIAGDVENPASLPPMVRLGIAERLSAKGGAIANQAIQLGNAPKPEIPAEAKQRQETIQSQADEARGLLDDAMVYNLTLVGDDMEGTVLARGLYNLGFNIYFLTELDRVTTGKLNAGRIIEAAEHWVAMGERVPDAEDTVQALKYAMNLSSMQDVAFNKDAIQKPSVREVYKQSFEHLLELAATDIEVHNQRVYAGFYLYEKTGDYLNAAKVYRDLPRDHRDYYQARRQLLYVMQRLYRNVIDRKRVLEASKPADNPPAGANPDQVAKHQEDVIKWQADFEQVETDIERVRGELVEEAELVMLDAVEEAEEGDDAKRRFEAATALGAAKVVLAGVKADMGDANLALELLAGFEERFGPEGAFARLGSMQQNPEGAKAILQGLVQSAQQERILTLLQAGKVNDMVAQARVMMDNAPDVAAGVVSGVLGRIRSTINREKRIAANAPFKRIKDQAEANIKFNAEAAVSLSELLVQWAKGQGYDEKKMVAYRLPLADALVLAGRPKDALDILQPIVKQIPNNFRIRMQTGEAYIEMFRQAVGEQDKIKMYNGAMEQFAEIVKFFNIRPEKPDYYWQAWLNIIRLKDLAGGAQAKEIPGHARMLITRVDENLGGPQYKEEFMELFDRNGGIERLTPE